MEKRVDRTVLFVIVGASSSSDRLLQCSYSKRMMRGEMLACRSWEGAITRHLHKNMRS